MRAVQVQFVDIGLKPVLNHEVLILVAASARFVHLPDMDRGVNAQNGLYVMARAARAVAVEASGNPWIRMDAGFLEVKLVDVAAATAGSVMRCPVANVRWHLVQSMAPCVEEANISSSRRNSSQGRLLVGGSYSGSVWQPRQPWVSIAAMALTLTSPPGARLTSTNKPMPASTRATTSKIRADFASFHPDTGVSDLP
jgi:hypothetical protein